MGSAVDVGPDEFKASLEKGGILFVDFWAPWCGPCRSFAPVYEKVAAANPDVAFAKVNTEEHQELAGMFRIQAIPTLMVFRDRVLLFSQPGALPQAALEELLGKVRALDMAAVHAEIAAQEKEALPS